MNLRNVRVIALKELRDVLRDRRTLIFMLALPIAVIPLLMIVGTKFVANQKQAKEDREITIAADPATQATLEALGKLWVQQNGKDWAAWGQRKLQIEAARAAEEAGLLDGAEAEIDEDAEPPKLPNFDDEHERGMARARSVERFLELTEFVDPGSFESDVPLAAGVEIPEGVPETLARASLAVAVQDKDIDMAVWVAPDALVQLEETEGTVQVHTLYDSSITMSDEADTRLGAFVSALDSGSLEARVFAEGLPEHFTDPIAMDRGNIATASRKVQAALGGIIPYLLLIMCFSGAMYPALDLTAGEKERFTMETLLLSPASRFEIAVGKFLVVFFAGIVAAVLSTSSMVLTITQGILPGDLVRMLDLQFEPLAVVLTLSLVIPVAAIYAGMLLGVGLIARSFKEAQSYTVPLQFLFVLPSMVSLIPDVEAESHMAWIPFVNISLLVRELLKGNYLWSFYGITIVSTMLVTLGTLWFAAWLFRRESVLMRA